MIIKSHESKKIDLKNKPFLLLYGKNEGLKNQLIIDLIKKEQKIFYYEEKEILENSNKFIENTLTKSLFENEKIILIKRSTDKIFNVIDEINKKEIKDLIIIINSENLEKRSKLRSFFEKSNKHISIAFYPDTVQTLTRLTQNFLLEKKILVSKEDINLIVNKSNGDREDLINELKKIEYFNKNGKKINTTIIKKLINLNENQNISELVDNCLAKNKKKTNFILNENHFTKEDCILITRTFLNKSKKILKLSNEYSNNRNLDLTISTAKPPIFWKDKEITKQQVHKWNPESIRVLIYKLNEIELNIKKNFENSVNIITDFVIEQSSSETSN